MNADTKSDAESNGCACSAVALPNFTGKQFRNVDELKQAALGELEFAGW
jgi:hypothetical protein